MDFWYYIRRERALSSGTSLEFWYIVELLSKGSAGNEEAQTSSRSQDTQVQLAEEDEGSLRLVIEGNVAKIVLKNALEAIPRSLDFRMHLLDTVEESALPGIKSLTAVLSSDLEVNLPSKAVGFFFPTLSGHMDSKRDNMFYIWM